MNYLAVILSISIFVCSFFCSQCLGAEQKRVSLKFSGKERPFSEIKESIEKQTGLKIIADESLGNVSVGGEFENVTLETLLQRIFKNENYYIITGAENRTVVLKSLGEKQVRRNNSYSSPKKTLVSNEVKENGDMIDPVTGMSNEKLNRLLEKQVQDGLAKYENKGIDPTTGLPIKELQEKLARQVAVGKEKYDQQGIDPVTGLSTSELQAKLDAQVAAGRLKYELQGIDPVTGMPISELKAKLEAQDAAEKLSRKNQ